ncbi:MAG: ABC transporter ATP-binding protein [Alphaproteobacteria bacterium]
MNKTSQQPKSDNKAAGLSTANAISDNILLRARGITKTFKQGQNTLNILSNLDLKLEGGEITALVGPSGSGKSTLLQILGLLDKPTSGQLLIAGKAAEKMGDRARTKLRLTEIGFIYQFHHLLPEFTALENVAMPQIILGVSKRKAHEKAMNYLKSLGLEKRASHRPPELSGGEQQRVAIARALINEPKLLFADEPTGNLDPETSDDVFTILLDQVRKRKIGALIATHNLELADQMDRTLELKSGKTFNL